MRASQPPKKPDKQLDLSTHAPTATTKVLPTQLRIGDRLTDETGTDEVVARPYTTAGGKTANVRVKRVDSEATMVRIWGAHEHVAVRRRGGVRWPRANTLLCCTPTRRSQ